MDARVTYGACEWGCEPWGKRLSSSCSQCHKSKLSFTPLPCPQSSPLGPTCRTSSAKMWGSARSGRCQCTALLRLMGMMGIRVAGGRCWRVTLHPLMGWTGVWVAGGWCWAVGGAKLRIVGGRCWAVLGSGPRCPAIHLRSASAVWGCRASWMLSTGRSTAFGEWCWCESETALIVLCGVPCCVCSVLLPGPAVIHCITL